MKLPDRQPEEQRDNDHLAIVFVVVAVVLLGSLLLLSHLAVGAAPAASPPAVAPAPTVALPDQGGAATSSSASGISKGTSVEAGLPAYVVPSVAPPAIGGVSYAVLERSCGALLYGRNEHQRLPPASLTKIVTALALEDDHVPLDATVDVTVSATQMAKAGSSVMGLEPQMRLSVNDLLYGLFLPSGNDAALTLAQYAGGGNVNRFVDMMNSTATALGMRDTHFTNPHGLDNPGLYSSAFDMALAGRALLADPLLSRISDTKSYMPAWNGPLLHNGNRLLDLYPGAYGVKIGFTDKAHETIVAAANRNGRDLIVSLFGSDDLYTDTMALLDWAFASLPSGCPNLPNP